MKQKDALFHGKKAREYDDFGKAIPHHDAFQRKVADLVQREKGDIAELGVGTGITLSFVLEKELDRSLHAIDRSPEMADIVRGRFAHPKLTVEAADARDFLRGRRFDTVYAAYVIHNMPKDTQEEIFSLIFSSLGSGGAFVDGDIFAYSDKMVQERVFAWQLELCKKLPSPLSEEWVAHYNADAPNYFTLQEAVSLLIRIGFIADVHFREGLEAVILARKPGNANK